VRTITPIRPEEENENGPVIWWDSAKALRVISQY
jgi:hypothetical protein